MTPPGATKTSRSRSCWPWSISPSLDALADDAESVAGLAHVQEDEGVLVGHNLRRDNSGVGSKRRLHHQLHRIGLQAHVVVTEEKERRTFDHQRGFVAGRAEAAVLFEHAHEGVGGDCRDALGDVRGVPVRHDEQAQFFVVLAREGSRRRFKARPGTGGNDDGNNGRSTRVHQFFKASWLGNALSLLEENKDTRERRILDFVSSCDEIIHDVFE